MIALLCNYLEIAPNFIAPNFRRATISSHDHQLSRTLLASMSSNSLPGIEVTVPPRRFPSGYVNGVRPSHHMNNTKTKFANPWQSFRLVAVDVYSTLFNLCRSQTFFQLLSVRDFARGTYYFISVYNLGDPSSSCSRQPFEVLTCRRISRL